MISEYISNFSELLKNIKENKALIDNLEKAALTIKESIKNGNKILIAGNGGSAADAQHFAAELVGRYKSEKRKAYPAIALTTNTSIITALSNDYGFEDLFSRQLEALGKKDDIFIAISTSGNSSNIKKALKVSEKLRLKNICILGKNGGDAVKNCELSLVVPSDKTSHIQEIHIMFIHIICEYLE